jgi:nucleolin
VPVAVAVSEEVETEEDEEEEEEGSGGEEFSDDLRVFVGNLPFSVDSAQLAGLFEQAGSVEMVEVTTPFVSPY